MISLYTFIFSSFNSYLVVFQLHLTYIINYLISPQTNQQANRKRPLRQSLWSQKTSPEFDLLERVAGPALHGRIFPRYKKKERETTCSGSLNPAMSRVIQCEPGNSWRGNVSCVWAILGSIKSEKSSSGVTVTFMPVVWATIGFNPTEGEEGRLEPEQVE